jgi:hypothetical protein
MMAIPDCDHEWEPLGTLGPYPTEICVKCNSGAILPIADHPRPIVALSQVLDLIPVEDPPEG